MTNLARLTSAASAATLALILGCGDGTPTSLAPSVPNASVAANVVLPAFPGSGAFGALVDNPYYPLIPGTTFHYRTLTPAGVETNSVEVTTDKRVILGVAATVVHDQVFLDGALTEDTYDYYAQEVSGNVWYFGEHSCEIENGQCVSTAGSWEAGVNGAQPGIIMWADPAAQKNTTYRQEYLAGEAEDVAKVLSLNAHINVPYGKFAGCLETMDWSLLEHGVREHKFYCAGTGLVLEVAPRERHARSELVSIQKP